MLIAVSQTISDASMKEQAPAGRCYDDPWGVAREVAACLRQQYRAWLEQQFPTALIEVDRVREGNSPHSAGLQVAVFHFGRMDGEIGQSIQSALEHVAAGIDLGTINRKHLLATAS
jgi:hypothetical protein